jgi:hypothetical protein
MSHPGVARRRWFGVLFLILAAGMLIWGQTILRPYLHGGVFVVYWLVCLVLTGLAMVVALLDARATRLRVRSQQQELLRRAIEDVPAAPKDPRRPKR